MAKRTKKINAASVTRTHDLQIGIRRIEVWLQSDDLPANLWPQRFFNGSNININRPIVDTADHAVNLFLWVWELMMLQAHPDQCH